MTGNDYCFGFVGIVNRSLSLSPPHSSRLLAVKTLVMISCARIYRFLCSISQAGVWACVVLDRGSTKTKPLADAVAAFFCTREKKYEFITWSTFAIRKWIEANKSKQRYFNCKFIWAIINGVWWRCKRTHTKQLPSFILHSYFFSTDLIQLETVIWGRVHFSFSLPISWRQHPQILSLEIWEFHIFKR